MMLHNVNNNQA